MEEVIKDHEYWSKAYAFLLPLTGLSKNEEFELSAYLFWRDYSIDNYNLIISFSYEDEEKFKEYCTNRLFPILDKKGYLVENYDIQGRSIFILDISEWALDIEMFKLGKYSKFSKEMKSKIETFHLITKGSIPWYIWAALNPNMKKDKLGGKTPIEYVAHHYGLDLDEMLKVGEIGSAYDVMSETLITDVEEFCQTDSKSGRA